MINPARLLFLSLLLILRSCEVAHPGQSGHLEHQAVGTSPEVLAVYEAWFGHPRHIAVGYSSHDPTHISAQIDRARSMGISGFVVDWYGDREPFIDKSYAMMQAEAAKQHFAVAMMYDETDADEDATDEAIADFTMFHKTYLSPGAPGHEAYLTYDGRPVIFIFPKGRHTDWEKVRAVTNRWKPAPVLIQENLPGTDADAFDGFYAWVNPGAKGWAADGGNWGDQYLTDFYQTMQTKYPGKIIVGGAWATFNDSKASWGLNRQISARCGQTFKDTFNFWKKEVPAGNVIPFVLVETWNDYEEGTAVERGIPSCGAQKEATLQSAL
jgi:hypothetical protein